MKATAVTALLTTAYALPVDAPSDYYGVAPASLRVRPHQPAPQRAEGTSPSLHPSPAAPGRWRHGTASWYRPKSSHVRMYGHRMLVAHRTIRPTTRLEVRCGDRRIVVTVCGYGPAQWTGRQLDLSRTAFARLAHPGEGVVQVRYRRVR